MSEHDDAYSVVKELIECEVVLAYPEFNLTFQIYMDTSRCQLGVIIYSAQTPYFLFQYKIEKPVQTKDTIIEF